MPIGVAGRQRVALMCRIRATPCFIEVCAKTAKGWQCDRTTIRASLNVVQPISCLVSVNRQ
jgi:hypothetical protein